VEPEDIVSDTIDVHLESNNAELHGVDSFLTESCIESNEVEVHTTLNMEIPESNMVEINATPSIETIQASSAPATRNVNRVQEPSLLNVITESSHELCMESSTKEPTSGQLLDGSSDEPVLYYIIS
jgi:hypothetical protein